MNILFIIALLIILFIIGISIFGLILSNIYYEIDSEKIMRRKTNERV